MFYSSTNNRKRKQYAKWTLRCLGVIFAALMGLYFYSQREVSQIEIQFPPIGKQIQLDGFKMHYIDEGSGPALVLIHGSTTTLRDFSTSILTHLTPHFRVVAFDRPGHGYSTYPEQFWMNPEEQAAAIHDALQKLGIHRSVWVGHSWAGAVVMAGLLKYTQNVRGGVLIGGAAYHWQGGVSWTNHIPDLPVVGKLFANVALVPVGRLLMDASIANVFLPNPPPEDYRNRTGIELVLRPSHFIVNGRDVRLLSDYLMQQSKQYATIKQPLLIIHGREDDIVPAWNHADRLVKLLPQVEIHELPNIGHAPHHVQKKTVARLITAFYRIILGVSSTESLFNSDSNVP